MSSGIPSMWLRIEIESILPERKGWIFPFRCRDHVAHFGESPKSYFIHRENVPGTCDLRFNHLIKQTITVNPCSAPSNMTPICVPLAHIISCPGNRLQSLTENLCTQLHIRPSVRLISMFRSLANVVSDRLH